MASMKSPLVSEKSLHWIAIALPWAALGYGLRFSFFGLPSTALEVFLGALVLAFVLVRGPRALLTALKELPSRNLLLAWVAVGLAAALWSPALMKGLGLWRAYILEPVIMIALVNQVLTSKRDRDDLRTSLWTVSIFVSIWALVQFVTGRGIPSEWSLPILDGRRATGPYGFPNGVALFVAPIAAYAGARAWILRERLAGATAILGLFAALVARSDGGALAILAGWTLAFVVTKWGRRLVALGAVAGGTVAIFVPRLADAIWKGLTFQGWSGRVRIWMWQETWQMLKAHWLLGAGIGGYPVVFDGFHKKRFIEIFQYPHQFILTAWSEVGLPGLILFFGLLASWVRRAWRAATTYPERAVGLAPLAAIVVHGLVDVPYWKNDLAVIFFLLWWAVAWVDQMPANALR